jgi:hypothetical protein
MSLQRVMLQGCVPVVGRYAGAAVFQGFIIVENAVEISFPHTPQNLSMSSGVVVIISSGKTKTSEILRATQI